VKTFTVFPDKYLVRMAVKVGVRVAEGTEARQQLVVSVYSYQDPAKVKGGSTRVAPRVWASSTMREGTIVETDVVSLVETRRYEPAIQWTGFEHPYLLVGYAPRIAEGERVEKHTSATNDGQPHGFMWTYLQFPQTTFKHGDAARTREVVAYLGPKNYDDLEQADAAAGFSTGFNKVIDLGWFAFIGRPLLWLLQKFHEGVGNWGIAIILLTFVVKVLTLYWTTKSMRSMKAMAALAPQMKALQEKYGDDKQRQQAETMALYKQHNVNPVAGCLPILLQMPIWIALYRMLSNAGELYQQPFIPGWIEDLTATDPVYVLPALLVVTMFLQARLQPATADSRQQKFLQYGMPLMFGVMSFFFPSGLTIYIFTNTVLSALHSIYMNKFDKKSLAIAAQLKKNQEAVTTTAKGGAKDSGPPKAKRVIDAKATEVPDDRADDGADADGAPADAVGTPGSGARNRPRRKKRRR
jgi:YidC/Oxa1 family membrane protein insertase